MLHSIVGLSIDQIGTVVNILTHTDNKDLATLYLLSLSVIDSTFMLILKEMFSSRTHILYWTELAKSSSWDISFYKLNCKIIHKIFNSTEAISILDNRDAMLQHADILRSDFYELSIFLDKINNAAGYLKSIYIELITIGNNVLSKSFDTISEYNRSTIKSIAHNHIQRCLMLIHKTFQEYLPHFIGSNFVISGNGGGVDSSDINDNDNDMTISDLNQLLSGLEDCVDSISSNSKNEVYHTH